MRASPCSMRRVEDLRARWPTAFAPVSRGPPLRVEVARSDLVNCWLLRKREPAEPRRTAAWHGVPAGTWRAALDQANDVNGVAAWPVSLDRITPYWVFPRWHFSCGSVSAGGCGKLRRRYTGAFVGFASLHSTAIALPYPRVPVIASWRDAGKQGSPGFRL